MLDELQVLRTLTLGTNHKINDNLVIHHPTLEEICDFGEQKYFGMATSLSGNSSLYKVDLFEMGIKWDSVDDYEFFCMISRNMPIETTKIIFGNLDFSQLEPCYNFQTEQMVLAKKINGSLNTIIDRALYMELVTHLRAMHGFTFEVDKPEDDHTRKYMIDREKRRLNRKRTNKFKSALKPMILSMVNQAGFKYDYSTVWKLPISAFIESVHRTQKFIHYTNTIAGAFSGTIDLKKINLDELSWLS